MIVALCFALHVVMGFDILVMAFATPAVDREWNLPASWMGLLLSSVLIGMALGTAATALLASRLGRRPSTLIGLAVASAGMLLSTEATGFAPLCLFRVLTGIGVGVVMTSVSATVSECSNGRARAVSLAVFVVGLPLGGASGGSIAPLLTAESGWRASFLLGSALTAFAAAAVIVLPSACGTRRPTAGTPGLPGPGGTGTVLLALSFLGILVGLHFARSWTPRPDSSFLVTLGGTAAGLLAMLLTLRFPGYALALVTFAGSSAAFIVITASLGDSPATMTAAVLMGITISATGTSVYASAPALSRTEVRDTAVGWASTAGRLGSVVAPIVAGLLVDNGWHAPTLFFAFSVPLFGSALAMLVLSRRRSQALVTSTAGIPSCD